MFLIYFFPAISSLKTARQENQTGAAMCCPQKYHLLFPGVDNSAAKCPQFNFSSTRREKHLQFLVSQGAFQAYSPKLPHSCWQLHSTHTRVIDKEERKRRNDPTTDLSDICWQNPSEERLLSCWFSTYTLECALGPPALPEYPSPYSLLAKFNPRFKWQGYLSAFREKGSEHFYCVKNNVFLTNLLLGNQWIILAEFFHKQRRLKQTLDTENLVQMKHSETLSTSENRTCKWEMMGKP